MGASCCCSFPRIAMGSKSSIGNSSEGHDDVNPTYSSISRSNKSDLDPIQSIYGGAQYLADLTSSMKYGTSSGDKIAFVLAAYNLGTTNVKNAIDAIDKNPQEVTWLDLEELFAKFKILYGFTKTIQEVNKPLIL